MVFTSFQILLKHRRGGRVIYLFISYYFEMTRKARSCCGTGLPQRKKKETGIPEPIQSDLDRIGGIAAIASGIPDDAALLAAGRVHHALSDPLRLKVLYLIRDQPLCVCVIKEFFRIADSKLSYHLTILKDAGFISGEYCGNWIIYSITAEGREAMGFPRKEKR
jgi:ArsR family transcriptional regulator